MHTVSSGKILKSEVTKETELCSQLATLRADVSLSYRTGLTEHKTG